MEAVSDTAGSVIRTIDKSELRDIGLWETIRLAMADEDSGPPLPYGLLLGCLFLPVLLIFAWELTIAIRNAIPPRGCTKLGLKPTEQSNMHDEFDDVYSPESAKKTHESQWRIKSLFIYPIKSCAPVEVSSSPVLRTGFLHDRQFCFATLEKQPDATYKWKFITQRQYPKLALVKPEIWLPTGATSNKSATGFESGTLIVNFPAPSSGRFAKFLRGIAPKLVMRSWNAPANIQFRVSLYPTAAERKNHSLLTKNVQIWAANPAGIDLGPLLSTNTKSDLASFLGVKTTLSIFRVDRSKPRPVALDPPPASDIGYEPIVGFADSYPMHIENLASVHDIAAQLPESFPTSLSGIRFRANIYVTGPPAFAEDSWKQFTVLSGADGSRRLPFRITVPASRCSLPNVNPSTGTVVPYHPSKSDAVQGKADEGDDSAYNEPLKTLKRLRHLESRGNKPVLGMQMLPGQDPDGAAWEVRVGDHFVASTA